MRLFIRGTEKQYGGPPSYQGSSQYQGYGGFSPQEPQPPRGADPQYVPCMLLRAPSDHFFYIRTFRLWSWFTSVDKDHSGSISPVELRKLPWAAVQTSIVYLQLLPPEKALVNGDWSRTSPCLL